MYADRENLLDSVWALPQYLAAVRRYSDRFSVFNVLNITDMEIRHSEMLAWLLNPHGDHGLADAFLKSFLKIAFVCGLEDLETFRVEREQDNIDLLLVSYVEKTVIAVENKIWAKEGFRATVKNGLTVRSQLEDYEKDVERQFPHNEFKQCFVFLTPEGELPKGGVAQWKPVSYRAIVNALQDVMRVNRLSLSHYIAEFIDDYIETLKKDVLMEYSREEEDVCLKIYSANRKAVAFFNGCIDTVFKHRFDTMMADWENDQSIGVTCYTSDNHCGYFRIGKIDQQLGLKPMEKLPCIPYALQLERNADFTAVCCNVLVYSNPEHPGKWSAFPWNAPEKARVNLKNWHAFDATGENGGTSLARASKEAINDVLSWLSKETEHLTEFNAILSRCVTR